MYQSSNKQPPPKIYFTFNSKNFVLGLKLTSHGILHYLRSADLSKSFPQLIMSIFIFSQYFFRQILPGGKVWGYPTLLISSFINFNFEQ